MPLPVDLRHPPSAAPPGPAPGKGHVARQRIPGDAVARRIFAVMVVATLMPMMLFSAIGYAWLSSEAKNQFEAHLAGENHLWADLLHQRMRSAAALLAALAQASSHAERSPTAGGATGGVLRSLVQVSPAGDVVAGDAATWARWQQAPSAEARDGPAAAQARLRWSPDAPGTGLSHVLLLHAAADGSRWIAQVDPAYLWAALPDARSHLLQCVTDTRHRQLSCPAAAAERSLAAAPSLRRSLYWDAEFGGGQWVITTLAPAGHAAQFDSLMLVRSSLLGGALTLLVVGAIGWLQWRRTATSLASLIDGTQRWAAQDWDARVQVRAGDEFEPLGQALNRMAERIGQQMRAIQVQSAIDREILGGLDLSRIMDLVARRLQALVPQARAAVVVAGAKGRGWVSHVAGERPWVLDRADPLPTLRDGEWALSFRGAERMPPWAARALAVPPDMLTQLCWVPVSWQGRVVAFLAIGARSEFELDEEVAREITELRDRIAVTLAAVARESALLQRAVHDGLTGLLNRNGLHDAVDAMLARGNPFVLVLVDLDRFKEVNDTLGHQAGDELLCAVANRLRACVSPGAQIARPGGDEFVLLLPGTEDEASAAAMAICAELARPFALRGVQQQIGGSLGLAAFPQHGQTRGELMRRADLAMYVSKGNGRGRFSWYVDAMDERNAQRAWMARELRLAVDRAHFELHFQPRVEAFAGQIVCAEVLLRWPHAQRGMIPPGEFVAAAEETGLIDRLGHWVLASAFQQMGAWRSAGLPLHRVAINVSARQLMAPGFAATVLELLARYGLSPTDIELELTESVFAGDVDAVCRVLEPLRDVGIQLALDDFGTGYSSLSSLYRLPVDVIKIDHSFVRDLGKRPSAEIMARSIVALAKALRKRVVAEGVETRSQRDHLLRLDCDELQGYLYGKPVPAAHLEQQLRQLQAGEPAATTRERRRSSLRT